MSTPQIRDDLFDLLTRMLTIDHTNRITAREAIQHSFFEGVREEVLSELSEEHR